MNNGGEELLTVRDLTITFGGIRAVEALSFGVPTGRLISLIGPNGAGKTTVLNSISGFVRAHGSIRMQGVELRRLPAFRRASLGIGRTFQNLQLFESMPLLENVLVGEHVLLHPNMLLDMVRFPVIERERRARERAMEMLALLGLDGHASRNVTSLPLGLQKLAGVARALVASPKLLLLDEPAAGLAREEADSLMDVILRLRAELDLSILLVEHNMGLVMRVSDRIVVLDEGHKLAEGTPEQIANDPAVIEAYLGSVDNAEIVEEVRDELAHGH